MPEIHYTDALLTVIFTGLVGFGGWVAHTLWWQNGEIKTMGAQLKLILEYLTRPGTAEPFKHAPPKRIK